jgi:hypothetical protein
MYSLVSPPSGFLLPSSMVPALLQPYLHSWPLLLATKFLPVSMWVVLVSSLGMGFHRYRRPTTTVVHLLWPILMTWFELWFA